MPAGSLLVQPRIEVSPRELTAVASASPLSVVSFEAGAKVRVTISASTWLRPGTVAPPLSRKRVPSTRAEGPLVSWCAERPFPLRVAEQVGRW